MHFRLRKKLSEELEAFNAMEQEIGY